MSTHVSPRRTQRATRGASAPARTAARTAPARFAAPAFSGMEAAVDEVRVAALDTDKGPSDPTDYQDLLERLDKSETRVPPIYRENAFVPYRAQIAKLGPKGFQEILLKDPSRESTAGLMLDIAHAFLQNGERYEDVATDAAQEVLSDLYDGFLSAEDRRGIEPPDYEVIPPLIKWGNPEFGPYTWPVDATLSFGLEVGVVNMPPANARAGQLAWTAKGHEVAGHDILHADKGLEAEVAEAVRKRLGAVKALEDLGLHEYWADRIDETASDVFGILNMGPTAAAGLIGYFRGLGAAWAGSPHLRSDGPGNDPHPADLLRAYLGAAVVAKLSFAGAASWRNAILAEARADDPSSGSCRLAGRDVPLAVAKQSAELTAEVLTTTPFESLEDHTLLSIQDWRNGDQEVTDSLSEFLRTAGTPDATLLKGFYAAHVVAAAATIALTTTSPLTVTFGRMIGLLKRMHDENPAWGPLYVSHRGNLYRHRGYLPAKRP